MIEIKAKINSSFENIRQAKNWIQENQNNENVLKTLKDTEYDLRKLYAATERKPCLGFFGESQVGKSFLVASLLAGEKSKLLVSQHLNADPLEFLDYVNPKKETEATAVVTRFTIDEVNTTSANHFLVEFLSPGELLRCIYEGFYLKRDDSDQDESTLRREDELIGLIGKNDGNRLSSESSIDFLDNYYKLLQKIKSNKKDWIFPRVEKIYTALLSLETDYSLSTIQAAAEALWIGYVPNSHLFNLLTKHLFDWGEPSKAFVHVSLLEKMLDASYLNQFRFNDSQQNRSFIHENLSFGGSKERVVLDNSDSGIDLSIIQILSKEVVLNIVSEHSDLLHTVDGLDFPGVKPLGDKDSHYSISEAKDDMGLYLLEIIKIGKLKHLFTLHIENRDLTNLLLCIQEGEQNPTQISNLIQDYIQQKVESTNYHAVDTLYTVMTKTDILFSQDVSEDGAMERWNTRFTTHFEDHYEEVAKLSQGEETYNKVFLVLNPNAPNYKKSEHIEAYKEAYLKNPYVDKYLYNRENNWESLLSEDGGIEFLHKSLLSSISNKPNQKLEIIREAYLIRLNKMISILSDLIPPIDEAEFVAKRKQEAADLLKILYDNPGDFEKLLSSIPSWIPDFNISEIMISGEPEGRRERRNPDIYASMSEIIISLVEEKMEEQLPVTSIGLMSIDDSSFIKLGNRIIAQARIDNSIRNYLERNKLSFRPDDNLSGIAFNQSVSWLICGLIYNLWESEITFENIDFDEPLENYYPSDNQYQIWENNLPKVYLMGRDERMPTNMDVLVKVIKSFTSTATKIGGAS
jgi:hypothetical protein